MQFSPIRMPIRCLRLSTRIWRAPGLPHSGCRGSHSLRMNSSREPRSQLRQVLGLREAVALGIGGTIGGGIFVLVGTAAGAAGPGALLSFVLAFGVSLLIALPYAELACRYPLAGGGYAFARALLGEHWGFLMGWGYW